MNGVIRWLRPELHPLDDADEVLAGTKKIANKMVFTRIKHSPKVITAKAQYHQKSDFK